MSPSALLGTSAKRFPADLISSLASNRLRLFVGSGPACAAGLPSWDGLVHDMAEAVRRENNRFSVKDLEAFLEKADQLDTAELFRETVGEHAYFRFLRERYRQDVRPSSAHRAIARLPATTVFTSNYDKLMEVALRLTNCTEPTVVIHPDQLNYVDEAEVKVIKLHGDIDHPNSIVLTRSDYASYGRRHQDFVQVFQASVNSWTLLFVGFGLRDPNFQRIYRDARNLCDSTNRQSYAIMAHTNLVDRELWHKEGLTILPVGHHSQLVGALSRLRSMSGVTDD